MSSATQTQPRKTRLRKSLARSARLDFRLTPEARERIETAAALSCQTLAEFASSVLLRESERIIERQKITYLSPENFEAFLATLANPPEISDVVKREIEHYKQHARREGDVTVINGDAFNRNFYEENGINLADADPH